MEGRCLWWAGGRGGQGYTCHLEHQRKPLFGLNAVLRVRTLLPSLGDDQVAT